MKDMIPCHEIRREVIGSDAPAVDSSVTLDVARYTSKKFADKEWQNVFAKTWQIACREDHIKGPGDHYVFQLGNESILVVRGDDKRIRAFYNVCRHRGNKLVQERVGKAAKAFSCSYHRWTWDIEGNLKHIPDKETFPGLPDKCQLGLKKLRAEVWGGFVFVSMDPNIESLIDYLGYTPGMLDRYAPDNMALVADMTIEWECNWKVALDAFNETYHVAATHPQLVPVIDDYNVQITCEGLHNAFYVPYGISSPRYTNRSTIPEALAQYMDPTQAVLDGTGKALDTDENTLMAGAVDPSTFKGTVDEVRKAIQEKKRSSQDNVRYLPYPKLSDAELTDDRHVMIFPNTQLNVFAENILMFRHRPNPDDPNKMYYDVWYLAHVPNKEEYEVPEHKFLKPDDDLGLALNQDGENARTVQLGMKSRSTTELYLSEQEARIRHFHITLDRYMNS